MRLSLLFLLAVVSTASQAQTWEKLIMPGLTYRMEIEKEVPRIIHALRYSPGAPTIQARTELAEMTVYSDDAAKGREELSSMLKRSAAFGGVNGDFFPYTGDPLGAMVRNGELVSIPNPKRSVFGWGGQTSAISKLKWRGAITTEDGFSMELDGLNEECGPNSIILNTETAGLALAKSPCTYAIIEFDKPSWKPVSINRGKFTLFYTDSDTMPIKSGNAIIAARGEKAKKLASLKPGSTVSIWLKTEGLDWNKIEFVIGGGPDLVRGGKAYADWAAAGFQESFALKRHPRTAIGRTKEGDIWMLAIDGRQALSDGATLNELAQIMLRLGCYDAMNLDGGGSTSIALFGQVQNRPSDGAERKISNAILFTAALPSPSSEEMAIQGPARIPLATLSGYKVVGPDGKPIPNAEVVWSCSGAAWIDQGGALHPIKAGDATISAYVRGRQLTIPVVVSG